MAAQNSRPVGPTSDRGALKTLVSQRGVILVILFFISATFVAAVAQSGRLKEKKSKPKSGADPIAESARPTNSSKTPTAAKEPVKDPGDEVETSDVVRISSNLVPIPASVVDMKGYAVTNLKLEDFELLIDGQTKLISDIAHSDTPVRLAMLFDNSGSIDFARDFEKQAAIHFFRKVMRASDEAAIYSVESDSYLAQPMTADVRKLEQTIENFGRPEGSTSLFDAIIDAAAYLKPYSGRRVIVIVSDGIETTSRADFETTLLRVLAQDCQVFVVQTGLYEGANLRALAAERRMEQLSWQTGGAAYKPKTAIDLETAFKQIAADLAQQYVLSYYQSDGHRDGRFHVIDLRIKSRKDVRVRARKVYYSRKSSSLATGG